MGEMDNLLARLNEIKTEITGQIRRKGLDVSISKFKGREDNRSFEDFVKEYCRLGDSYEWDEPALLKNLPQVLTGEALAAYELLTADQTQTWTLAKNALAVKFIDEDGEVYARCQLQTRKQRTSESVAEFGQAINQLVKKAYPNSKGFTEAQRISMTIDSFFQGLNKCLKEHLLRKPKPANLAEAISMAQKEQFLQNSLDKEESSVELKRAVCRLEDEVRGELNKMKQEFKSENEKISSLLAQPPIDQSLN